MNVTDTPRSTLIQAFSIVLCSGRSKEKHPDPT